MDGWGVGWFHLCGEGVQVGKEKDWNLFSIVGSQQTIFKTEEKQKNIKQ